MKKLMNDKKNDKINEVRQTFGTKTQNKNTDSSASIDPPISIGQTLFGTATALLVTTTCITFRGLWVTRLLVQTNYSKGIHLFR